MFKIDQKDTVTGEIVVSTIVQQTPFASCTAQHHTIPFGMTPVNYWFGCTHKKSIDKIYFVCGWTFFSPSLFSFPFFTVSLNLISHFIVIGYHWTSYDNVIISLELGSSIPFPLSLSLSVVCFDSFFNQFHFKIKLEMVDAEE